MNMIGIKEAAEMIGKVGVITIHGLDIEVKIIDVRNSWGRFDFLVCPVAGEGRRWVSEYRLRLIEGIKDAN